MSNITPGTGKRMPVTSATSGSSLQAPLTEAQCLVQIRLLFGEFDATTQVVKNELHRIGRRGCTQDNHDKTITILRRMLADVDRRLTLMADAVLRYGDDVDEDCMEQLDERVRMLGAACTGGMMDDGFETGRAVLEMDSEHIFEFPHRGPG